MRSTILSVHYEFIIVNTFFLESVMNTRTKQIPKNGSTPPFLGIFPLQKTRPKPGDSGFDPCLTHTGINVSAK